MAAFNSNSPELLSREILADARRESEEILQLAQRQAEGLLAKAAAEAEQIRREQLAQAQAEAARRRELILATVAVEAGRQRAARIETLLQSIRETTRQKLLARDGFDYRESIIALAAEALRWLSGDAFVVKLSPTDRAALGSSVAEEIRQRAGRSLAIALADGPTIKDGGAIIEDRDGRQVWDNRFSSRLERLWPELRRQIAVATSLVVQSGSSGASTISKSQSEITNPSSARQRFGVRQSSGAFELAGAVPKAAEDCRSPKPGGSSDALGKGGT
jgi:vacuolar-type H+-ATPase subunit E/Vma4